MNHALHTPRSMVLKTSHVLHGFTELHLRTIAMKSPVKRFTLLLGDNLIKTLEQPNNLAQTFCHTLVKIVDLDLQSSHPLLHSLTRNHSRVLTGIT
eukprot:14833_2